MKEISHTNFAAICFLVLCGNDYKHPSFIEEKLEMLNDGHDAMTRLKIEEKKRVIEWLTLWNYKIPDSVQEHYQRQLQAAMKLGLI